MAVALASAALAATSAGVAACGAPGSPSGATSVTAPHSAPAAARADIARRALRLVAVRPADVGYTLRLDGARDEIRAQTDTARRTITLFLRDGDPVNRVAHDLAHEIGHAVDATRLTDADRASYLAARGAPDARWYPAGGVSDLESGAGDFAEVFALCAAASQDFRSRLAPRPDDPCQELPSPARRILSR